MLLQILILFLVLIVLPVLVGSIFAGVDGRDSLSFRWVSGQLCLWAGFQAICVPMILLPRENSFFNVIVLYGVFAAAMLLLALGLCIKRRAEGWHADIVKEDSGDRDIAAFLLQGTVLVLLAVQIVLAVVLAYEEGDDAFYVATSSITAESGTMYEILPYTGGRTILFDARHSLAPFPIWIAMLSKISGVHAAAMAHVVLPVVLIVMAYAIFFRIGFRLFRDSRHKRLLFMLFLELLVIFGGQSLYTAENFLLVRTAQGKAVLADIIIPFLFLLLMILLERMQQKEQPGAKYWLLTAVTMIAGCLCSTQGALLTCMLLGVGGGCVAVCYRKWKLILPVAACCAVPVVLALLYLFLD